MSGFLPKALCPLEHCRPAVCLCRLWAASFVPWNLKWERQLCGRCLASPRCQTEQGGCILGGWEHKRPDSGYTVHASVHFQKVCDKTRTWSILLDIHFRAWKIHMIKLWNWQNNNIIKYNFAYNQWEMNESWARKECSSALHPSRLVFQKWLWYSLSKHFLKRQCQHHWGVFGCASQKSYQSVCQVEWAELLIRKCVEGRPAAGCSTHPLLINTSLHTPLLSAQGHAHPQVPVKETCRLFITIVWVWNLRLNDNFWSLVSLWTFLTDFVWHCSSRQMWEESLDVCLLMEQIIRLNTWIFIKYAGKCKRFHTLETLVHLICCLYVVLN